MLDDTRDHKSHQLIVLRLSPVLRFIACDWGQFPRA